MLDEKVILEISRLSFDGGTREGPRKDYLFKVLHDAGLNPSIDDGHNIWVEKGQVGSPRLYSAHMDIDQALRGHPFEMTKVGDEKDQQYIGVVDNAVGCALNLNAALRDNSGYRNIFVFTASEEEGPQGYGSGNTSAKHVVQSLSQKGITPELCVTVDVTYPRLLVGQQELFDSIDDPHILFKELFDQDDRTNSYIDGITRKDARLIAETAMATYKRRHIGNFMAIRDLTGFDESAVYSTLSPSFSFGPVGFGKFHEPGQRMPKRNVYSASHFLNWLVHNRVQSSTP